MIEKRVKLENYQYERDIIKSLSCLLNKKKENFITKIIYHDKILLQVKNFQFNDSFCVVVAYKLYLRLNSEQEFLENWQSLAILHLQIVLDCFPASFLMTLFVKSIYQLLSLELTKIQSNGMDNYGKRINVKFSLMFPIVYTLLQLVEEASQIKMLLNGI